MGRRKVNKELDTTSRYLMSQGTYSLKNSGNAADKMILKALKQNESRIYRFWLGVFYAFALMLSLYWLPLFGPMIAGYIGGKRAGSPTKGILVGIFVVGIFYLLSAPDMLAYLPANLSVMRDSMINTSVARFPWLEPAMNFVSAYTTPTVTLLSGKIAYSPQTYTILLVFAYIGGTIAKQRREEIKLLVLGRIAASIPVQSIMAPMPHHSAVPVQTAPVYGFENYTPVNADTEYRQIYREEFDERPAKKKKTAKTRVKTVKSHSKKKGPTKQDLIRNSSHAHHKTSRQGFL